MTLCRGTVFHLDFGKALPAKDITTNKEGNATLDGIPHGTKVTITEKSVPAPYTIDTTLMTATIKAGETISVTSKIREKKVKSFWIKAELKQVLTFGTTIIL